MKKEGIFLIVVGFASLLSLWFLLFQISCLKKENSLLEFQLEQTHSLAGRPINIAALPDGSYARADDDKHFAFVQSVADFPIGPVGVPYAVYCEKGEIPYHFATKDIRKEVEEFVRKNPPSPK